MSNSRCCFRGMDYIISSRTFLTLLMSTLPTSVKTVTFLSLAIFFRIDIGHSSPPIPLNPAYGIYSICNNEKLQDCIERKQCKVKNQNFLHHFCQSAILIRQYRCHCWRRWFGGLKIANSLWASSEGPSICENRVSFCQCK